MQKISCCVVALLLFINTSVLFAAPAPPLSQASIAQAMQQRLLQPAPVHLSYQLRQLMWKLFKSDDFESLWKKQQEFEDKGLTEDAKKVVSQIRQKAEAEKNHPQLVKALLHQYRYLQYNEENSAPKIVADLQQTIASADFPLKNVLQSILADNYWSYFNSNRYSILSRTKVADTLQDFETWDAQRFGETVNQLYLESLTSAKSLQSIPIKQYEAIVQQGDTESRTFRPTLYDFLAQRAIDFFSDSQSNLTKAAEQYQITDPRYFGDANTFVQLPLPTEATTLVHAIRLYQQLTQFHLTDAAPDALVDLELKRLDFVHQNTQIDNKDYLQYDAFVALEKKYPNTSTAPRLMYRRAQFHQNKGNAFHAYNQPESKDELKKAVSILQQIIQKYPKSNAAGNANLLIDQIKTKNIAVRCEHSNLPNLPFRVLVDYKNTERLYVRVIEMNEAVKKAFTDAEQRTDDYQQKKLRKFLSEQKSIWDTQVNLPNTDDYQNHSTEIKINALPIGEYILLCSADSRFSIDANALGYARLSVTEIAFINATDKNTANGYVVHRQTGQPLPNTNYEIFKIQYEYKNYRQNIIRTSIHKGTSDAEGYFQYALPYNPNDYGGNGYEVVLTRGKDQITTPLTAQYYEAQTTTQQQTFFFTDRSIYRPGQTVFFKGIMLQRGTDNTLLTNTETSVTLYDVNGQEIGNQTLKTNDFGSFNGKFVLPTNLLNGQMHLSNDIGDAYFSVEEYKRPKFEAKMQALEGSFRLNESITAKGTATAYAGNAISNAQVSYRVIRKASFPFWWCWWRPLPTVPDVEITNGKTTTDANGNFNITFQAIPDSKANPKDKPQYNYEIIADVTDLNGETQSTQTTVAVSYTVLLIQLAVPTNIDKSDSHQYALSTTNLSGQDLATKVEVSISELEQPKSVLRSRLWERPDQFVMTEKEYHAAFPNDIYDNEDDMATWKSKEVYRQNFNTPKDSTISLNELNNLPVGKYLIKMTAKDKFGETVTWQSYVTLFDSKSKNIPDNTAFWTFQKPNIAEPGQQVYLLAGSRLPNARMLYIVEHQNKIVTRKWINIAELQTQIAETVREEHRGGFLIRVAHVGLNRTQLQQYNVTVPWSNKELQVSLSTYRNKILPGSDEKWQVKISGHKGEKVAAELLANMYDASLDAFRDHQWQTPDLYPSYYYSYNQISFDNYFDVRQLSFFTDNWNKYEGYPGSDGLNYDQLNTFGFALYSENRIGRPYYMQRGRGGVAKNEGVMYDMAVPTSAVPPPAPQALMAAETVQTETLDDNDGTKKMKNGDLSGSGGKTGNSAPKSIQIRKNLQETAFFLPELRTNEAGEILLSFTAPEALTRWNVMLFAHTRDLKFGQHHAEVQTQKELMVQPNPPRFLREGDEMFFATKIANLSDKNLQGKATLHLFDAITGKAVEADFGLQKSQSFAVNAKQSTAVSWKIKVPNNLQAITYQVIADAKDFSDGEENALPILTNRMLVTESLPLPMRGAGTKDFTFAKLQQADRSNTLQHQSLTLEYTTQPAWYAIQALPYLMEYPHECSEQIFSRYYANSIGSHIANSDPRVKQVFEQWQEAAKIQDASTNTNKEGALFSNLEKNQELKYLLLQETPWVIDAQNEKERKRRIAVLFDLSRMIAEQEKAEQELVARQNEDGSFAWFKGMYPDTYITQHIATGFGHLDKLGVKSLRDNPATWQMVQKAVQYVDYQSDKNYQYLKERNLIKKDQVNNPYLQIQYLYMRSFFTDIPVEERYKESFAYWKQQAEKHWLQQSRYMQAMTAIALHRLDKANSKTAANIMESLRQNATQNEELGMYFKRNSYSWYWYDAPIEEQALMIEAFNEVTKDEKSVEALKVWLLKQKQTNDWKTTRATAEACYALLLTGDNWLQQSADIDINIGTQNLNPATMPDLKAEAGTGYFKKSWQPAQIQSEMGNVRITKKDKGVSWGALYWQYFEQLDKITFAETPLRIKKQLFLQKNTKTGVELQTINEKTRLKVGDLVTVRVEIRVDREMEYVHLKDMRAAGFEPVNVISTYKYQDGLGYYETTKDAATNFFMSSLPKGTYVFEYPLRASQKGNFSNGITTMQCMYAPEFTSHSEGIRVQIEE
ncbi:MAG: alpha-2-macroglobulin [Chitinophagales bacterium]|nr:alpha-2-macroglobulin [Chitinophagales bacterium]